MQNTLREPRTAADHPTRQPRDHANLDPRRNAKHPKITERARRDADRPGRAG